jgi:hypothetical protein
MDLILPLEVARRPLRDFALFLADILQYYYLRAFSDLSSCSKLSHPNFLTDSKFLLCATIA